MYNWPIHYLLGRRVRSFLTTFPITRVDQKKTSGGNLPNQQGQETQELPRRKCSSAAGPAPPQNTPKAELGYKPPSRVRFKGLLLTQL